MTYWGWYDSDAKKPVEQKLAAALDRFRQRRGHDATQVVVSGSLFEAIVAAHQAGRPFPAARITIDAKAGIPRHTFYLR